MLVDDAVWHASRHGLRVAFRDLGRRNGELHSSGLIIVNHRRNVIVQSVTIHHEVGHWLLNHVNTGEHAVPAQERAADLYAALQLISPVVYAAAERVYGADARTLAPHLEVTCDLVLEYQAYHDRRGRTVRMGEVEDSA